MKAFRFVAVGAFAGAVIGAAEGIFCLSVDPWWVLHAPLIAAAMLLYGAMGAAVALLAGLLGARSAKAVWLLMGGLGYLLGLFHVLKPFLPDIRALPCLLSLLAWTGLFAAAGFLAWKRAGRGAAAPGSGGKWKALLLGGLAVLAALSFLGPRLWSAQQRAGGGSAKTDGLNIVVIVMDTTRADHFSCYGYGRPTTPNVDRLAREGVLFEQATASAPWTLPSHASLFTGLYVAQHGTDRATPRLDSSLLTVGELLKGEGYQTVGFSNNPWVGPDTNFSQGFDLFEGMWKGSGPVFRLAVTWLSTRLKDRMGEETSHSADAATTNERIRWWLDQARRGSSPFFLFVNYIDVHSPYKPREPFKSRFLREEHRAKAEELKQGRLQRTAPPVRLDPVTEGVLNDLYDAELSYLDSKIGELVEMLRSRGVLDRTLFIVTSDHGENLGDHHILGHRFCIYQTLVRVPLVFRHPTMFSGGVRVKEPVSLIDVLPTLAQAARPGGVPLPPELLGRSLLAAPGEGPADQLLLSEYSAPTYYLAKFRKWNPGMDESYFTRDLKSVRRGNLKFIWGSDGLREMYDLGMDPAETVDLTGQQPDLARQMKEEADRFVAGLRPVGSVRKSGPMDENIRRELRALGYVQ